MDLLLHAVPLAIGGAVGALLAAGVHPDDSGTSPLQRWRRARDWRRRSLGGSRAAAAPAPAAAAPAPTAADAVATAPTAAVPAPRSGEADAAAPVRAAVSR